MGFSRLRSLSDMITTASTTSSSAHRISARVKVRRVFAAIRTQRIVLAHPTSRVMLSNASVTALSRPHSKIHSPAGVTDLYLQPLLAKVNNPSKCLIVLTLRKSQGMYFIYFSMAAAYEIVGLIL